MEIYHLLESKSYVAGGNVQVSLRDLPPGKRVKGFFLNLEATCTQSGSAAAVNGDDLVNVFANIECGKRIKGTGKFFDRLNWLMRGAQVALTPGLPATNSAVFKRTIRLVVPFYDANAFSALDCAPVSEFYRDTPLIVDFAGSALFSTVTITGTLRTWAILENAEVGVAPSIQQVGYTDWAGQQLTLEPGLYTHAFLYKDTTGTTTITNAEVSSISMSVDGQRAIDLFRPEELAFVDDYYHAKGVSKRTESTTAPTPGEQLTDEPAATAAADSTVTLEMVPLIVPPTNYKLTQCVVVDRGIRIDFQGTLTTFRVGWRRIEPRSVEQAVKAMAKTGVAVPDASKIKAKTASKAELSPQKAGALKYLPLRHE